MTDGSAAPLVQAEPLDIAEDAYAMRDAAIVDLHALGSPLWTDFNLHDPGVTFLDVLCYALADLGYLANSDVADHLASADGTIDFERLALFPPAAIFPTSPLTELDYRKVLLDELPELENVWFEDPEPVLQQLGWRAVKFVLRPGSTTAAGGAVAIAACLRRRRALGDMFLPPLAAAIETFSLTAEIDDSPTTGTEALLEAVVRAIQDALTPTIAFRIPSGASNPVDRFSGPTLVRGQVADDALWLPRSWEAAERCVTAAVAEVLLSHGASLRKLELTRLAAPQAQLGVYRLHTSSSTVIVHNAAGDAGDVFPLWTPAPELLGNPVATPTAIANDAAALPTGKFLDAARYRSIQHDLPALYQLSGKGDLETLSERELQILQLKAYLAVFDQVLANAHARLAATAALLSPHVDEVASWTQPIYGVDDITLLLAGYTEPQSAHAAREAARRNFEANLDNPYRTSLRAIASEWCHGGADRRALLLHLLARFGQSLPAQSAENFQTHEQLGQWLAAMPEFSRERGQAASSLAVPSTIERWAGRFLSLPGGEPRDALYVSSSTPDANGYIGRAHYIVEHGMLLDPSTLAATEVSDCGAQPGPLRLPAQFFARRLTQTLTNWTDQTLNPRFERYVRETLQSQLPAHLLVEWRWLSAEHMREFDRLYTAWAAAGFAGAKPAVGPRCCAAHICIAADGPAAELVKFLVVTAAGEAKT